MCTTRRHRCRRNGGANECVCPQSRMASLPSARRMKFPGCGSQWKCPWRSSIAPHARCMVWNTPSHPPHRGSLLLNACTAAAAGGHFGRRPLSRARLSVLSSLVPRARVETSTVSPHRESRGSGTAILSPKPRDSNSVANSRIFSASRARSNSSSTTSEYAAKTVGKSTPLSSPSRDMTRAVALAHAKSPSITFLSATITFTATRVLSLRRRAKCTCATEAVAAGVSSNSRKVASKTSRYGETRISSSAPTLDASRLLFISPRTNANGAGGFASIVFKNARTYASGIICCAVPMSCPIFVKNPPYTRTIASMRSAPQTCVFSHFSLRSFVPGFVVTLIHSRRATYDATTGATLVAYEI
mmetsp:Transcript_15077/g.64576  ORF Transcript_15077/g.64576 Transcript_15077/m.64576 type:complete len:358 (-) Transcript_15077:445-1518(-)